MFLNANKTGDIPGEIWNLMSRMRGAAEISVTEWRDKLIDCGYISLRMDGLSYIITVDALMKERVKKDSKPRVDAISNIPISELTSLLVERIRTNNPRVPITEKQKYAWAEDIRKMMEIDEVDYETIKTAIEFATTHEFWSGVILSAKSLRKHCRQLISRKRADEERASRGGSSAKPNNYIDREMEAFLHGE
jgi:predicted nucleic acid-binding protein